MLAQQNAVIILKPVVPNPHSITFTPSATCCFPRNQHSPPFSMLTLAFASVGSNHHHHSASKKSIQTYPNKVIFQNHHPIACTRVGGNHYHSTSKKSLPTYGKVVTISYWNCVTIYPNYFLEYKYVQVSYASIVIFQK